MKEICFSNVSVYYQGKGRDEIRAVDCFSYTFEKGKKYAVIGYSGCGKTTLANCLCGDLVFDGSITLDGKNIESIPMKDRHFAYVNQKFYLYPHMTIYDNIVFPLRNAKADHEYADERVKTFAKKLNVYYLLTRKPKVISIGQAARVVIARALIQKSDLMVFDEPLSNLDSITSGRVIRFIRDMADEYDSSVIYITHDVREALLIADKILVMDNGTLVGDFTPMGLLHSDNPVVQSLLGDLKKDEKEPIREP